MGLTALVIVGVVVLAVIFGVIVAFGGSKD